MMITMCTVLHARIANDDGNGQLLSRRYCKHSGWLSLVRVVYGLRVPRRFGGFAQVLQTVYVAVPGCQPTRPFVIIIKLTLNKIFEYVEMTIFSRPRGSPELPRRFDFFV